MESRPQAVVIHVDTHVAVWLYDDPATRIPRKAGRRLQHDPPVLSPMAELELPYLHQSGRIRPTAETVLAELARTLGLTTSTASCSIVVGAARELTWTRDPFDRLIVANALADRADLITADQRIREHLPPRSGTDRGRP